MIGAVGVGRLIGLIRQQVVCAAVAYWLRGDQWGWHARDGGGYIGGGSVASI